MLKKIFSFEKENHPYLMKLCDDIKSILMKSYVFLKSSLSDKLDLKGLWHWYCLAWGQSFSLDGRTARAPLFSYILVNFLIYQVLRLLLLLSNLDSAIALIIPFITIFPLFALYVRRFHDRNHSTMFALVPFVFLICLIPFGLFQAVVDMFQFQSMMPWQRFFNQSTLVIMLVCEFFASLGLWLVFLSMPSRQDYNKYGAIPDKAGDNFVLTCEVIFLVAIALSALFHGLFYLKTRPTTRFNLATHQVDSLFQSQPTVVGAPIQETKEADTQTAYKASHEKHKKLIERVSLKWVPTQPNTTELPLFSDEIPNNNRSDSLSDILDSLLNNHSDQQDKDVMTQITKTGDKDQQKTKKKTFLSAFFDDLFHNRPVTIKTNIFKQKKQRFIPNPFLTKKPQDFVVKKEEPRSEKQAVKSTQPKEVKLTYPQQSEALNKKMNQELIADTDSDVTIFNATKQNDKADKKKKELQQKLERLKKTNEIMQFLYNQAVDKSTKLPDTISQIKKQKDNSFIFILKREDLVPHLKQNNVKCVKTTCTFNIDDLL